MAVKTILDVEVKDESFTAFMKNFKEYKQELDKTPEVWEEMDKAAKKTEITFEGLVAAMLAQADYAESIREKQEVVTKEAEKQYNFSKNLAKEWEKVSKNARSFAVHIKDATLSLLRWSAITGTVTGLLGAGGLFGIERMAYAAGGWRRNSLGMGVSTGEQRAFDLNFGRIVNSQQFLGGVNESLHDVTKRGALYGAGLSEQDIQGRNSAEVSTALLEALKKIADQTPENMMAQVLQARRLDQFISLEDFQRLRNTPQDEIAGYAQRYRRDRSSLDMTKDQLRAWQDLQVQLNRAGSTIETVFIRGLTGLAPHISKLSDSFTKLVESFLNSNLLGDWIEKFGKGMDWLADEIDKPAFHKAVEDFARDVVEFAKGIGNALAWLKEKVAWAFGSGSTSSRAWNMQDGLKGGEFGLFGGFPGMHSPITGWGLVPGDYGLPGYSPFNEGNRPNVGQFPSLTNPGGMPTPGTGNRPDRNRNPTNLGYYPGQPGVLGSDGRFGRYATNEEGIFAAWNQLQINQRDYGLNTIEGQINRWAPKSDGNDTEGYIKRVASETGYKRDQVLDFRDAAVANRMLRSMAGVEGSSADAASIARGLGISTRASTVNININNNTGGSAVVTTSQVQ